MKRNSTVKISMVFTLIVLLAALTATADTKLYFIHNDHLGTPQVVTDENQQVVWEGQKKPFGETEEVVNTIDQPVRFPGQWFDEESGLYYNYYRDYDPSLGRYIQSDPIGIAKDFSGPQLQIAMQQAIDLRGGTYLHDPFQLNHNYGYVDQDPLGFIDPFGLYNGEVTNGSAWSGYNSGGASAFSVSTNNAHYQFCMSRCMNNQMSTGNLTCKTAGEIASRRFTIAGGMLTSLVCNVGVSYAQCNSQCSDSCPNG